MTAWRPQCSTFPPLGGWGDLWSRPLSGLRLRRLMAAAAGTAAAPGPGELQAAAGARSPTRGHPERQFRSPEAYLGPSAPQLPPQRSRSVSAPRPALDQVPAPSPPQPPQTAEQAGSLQGSQVCAPPPPAAKIGLGRGKLGVYIWTVRGPRARRVQTPRLTRAQCWGRRPKEGAGRPGLRPRAAEAA